jgi:hypothetical protein
LAATAAPLLYDVFAGAAIFKPATVAFFEGLPKR